MHVHCHLAECLHDFGPAHTFWLFAFERYNDMLGSIPSNQKGIETQIMEKMNMETYLYSIIHKFEISTNISHEIPFLKKILESCDQKGIPPSFHTILQFRGNCLEDLLELNWSTSNDIIVLSKPNGMVALTSVEVENIYS